MGGTLNDFWVKAQYDNKIKRIFNPPSDYLQLISVLRHRFTEIEKDLNKE
jgi:hypothetical protein